MSTKNSNFFSRDCMVQALIQLLKTKSLSNITITELTGPCYSRLDHGRTDRKDRTEPCSSWNIQDQEGSSAGTR